MCTWRRAAAKNASQSSSTIVSNRHLCNTPPITEAKYNADGCNAAKAASNYSALTRPVPPAYVRCDQLRTKKMIGDGAAANNRLLAHANEAGQSRRFRTVSIVGDPDSSASSPALCTMYQQLSWLIGGSIEPRRWMAQPVGQHSGATAQRRRTISRWMVRP